jgi:ketosteroid isomerase-like protein
MSQENVERARAAYEVLALAISTGDLDPFFAGYVHPEIEWVPLEGALDMAHARGHEAVKARMAAMLDVMDEPRIEAEEFIDAGEKVIVAFTMSGRGSGSGVDVEANWFHVVTARDNRAVRIEWYATREAALQAAGLRE